MNGEDFISVAGELADAGTEAHWRSAISRAYYGAFHVARNALVNRGASIPGDSSAHIDVQNKLIRHKNKDVSNAGSLLANLRTTRNKSDYELVFHTVTQNNAALHSRVGQLIVDCVKKHL